MRNEKEAKEKVQGDSQNKGRKKYSVSQKNETQMVS